MPWFRVDDTLHSHPKTRRAGLAALGLWTVAGSYACQYITEGFVPGWLVSAQKNGPKLAQILVSSGLWERGERDGEKGYQFHDWDHFQMSKEEILADREHNRERQRRFREKKRAARNAVTNGVTNGGSNGTPTLPNPTSTTEVSSSGYVSNASEPEIPITDEPLSKPVSAGARQLSRAYTDIVKLVDVGRICMVITNALNADFTDEQIRPALTRLAKADMPVTPDTLRIEINGRQSTNGHTRGPKEIPGAGGGMAIQL